MSNYDKHIFNDCFLNEIISFGGLLECRCWKNDSPTTVPAGKNVLGKKLHISALKEGYKPQRRFQVNGFLPEMYLTTRNIFSSSCFKH